ncbi:MAG: urease accessory protein UreF [Verrucomicrobia bacterium]|nr:urease accessory protein UreF [Verrucomicrobiota bacterium]
MNSAPAIGIEEIPAWLPGLLQTCDSAYPTGGYAHSGGLEGLVQAGVVRDTVSLERHLQEVILPALRQVELPLAAQAWRALARPDWERVGELCFLSSALRPAQELRLAAENTCRQRVELLAHLHPNSLATAFHAESVRHRWPGAQPIASALEGRLWGAPEEAVLVSLGYGTLAGSLAAAMKLLRIGQNAVQGLLTTALRELPAAIATARQLRDAEMGWFNPWLEITSARHESADHRMFIS